jgi:hypothetical protein
VNVRGKPRCKDCGCDITLRSAGSGRHKSRCAACQRERTLVSKREEDRKKRNSFGPRQCKDCGCTIEIRRAGRGNHRQRCVECQRRSVLANKRERERKARNQSPKCCRDCGREIPRPSRKRLCVRCTDHNHLASRRRCEQTRDKVMDRAKKARWHATAKRELRDAYVRGLLVGGNLSASEIPVELVDLKRVHIQIDRELCNHETYRKTAQRGA